MAAAAATARGAALAPAAAAANATNAEADRASAAAAKAAARGSPATAVAPAATGCRGTGGECCVVLVLIELLLPTIAVLARLSPCRCPCSHAFSLSSPTLPVLIPRSLCASLAYNLVSIMKVQTHRHAHPLHTHVAWSGFNCRPKPRSKPPRPRPRRPTRPHPAPPSTWPPRPTHQPLCWTSLPRDWVSLLHPPLLP
jgi:hypothetical protein